MLAAVETESNVDNAMVDKITKTKHNFFCLSYKTHKRRRQEDLEPTASDRFSQSELDLRSQRI